MALDQSIFSAHWCVDYSKYWGFLADGISNASSPLPFLDHGSATKTLIAHWDNTDSLRKQLTFGDATTGFPTKWSLRNKRRNSILMTHHYPDLGSDVSSVWNFCARFSGGETTGSIVKCWLFSQDTICGSRQYPYAPPPQRKIIGNSEGEEGPKGNYFRGLGEGGFMGNNFSMGWRTTNKTWKATYSRS